MSRHGRRRRGDPVAPRTTGTTATGRPPVQGDSPEDYTAEDYAADGADYGVRTFDAEDFGTGYFAADGYGYAPEYPADSRHDNRHHDDLGPEDGRPDDRPADGHDGASFGPETDWDAEGRWPDTDEDDGPWRGEDAEAGWEDGAAAWDGGQDGADRDRVGRGGARTAARVLTTDLAERVKPEPFEGTEMWAAVVGTVVWAGLFVASLVMHGTLSNSGRGWWTYTCVAGVGVGLLGVHQIRRRRMAGALRSSATDDGGTPQPSDVEG